MVPPLPADGHRPRKETNHVHIFRKSPTSNPSKTDLQDVENWHTSKNFHQVDGEYSIDRNFLRDLFEGMPEIELMWNKQGSPKYWRAMFKIEDRLGREIRFGTTKKAAYSPPPIADDTINNEDPPPIPDDTINNEYPPPIPDDTINNEEEEHEMIEAQPNMKTWIVRLIVFFSVLMLHESFSPSLNVALGFGLGCHLRQLAAN